MRKVISTEDNNCFIIPQILNTVSKWITFLDSDDNVGSVELDWKNCFRS